MPCLRPTAILYIAFTLTTLAGAENRFADHLADEIDAVAITCADEAHAHLAETSATDPTVGLDQLACLEMDGAQRTVRNQIDLYAERLGAETLDSWRRYDDGGLERSYNYEGEEYEIHLQATPSDEYVQYAEVFRVRGVERQNDARADDLLGLYLETYQADVRVDCFDLPPRTTCATIWAGFDDVASQLETMAPPAGVESFIEWERRSEEGARFLFSAVTFEGRIYSISVIRSEVLFGEGVFFAVTPYEP